MQISYYFWDLWTKSDYLTVQMKLLQQCFLTFLFSIDFTPKGHLRFRLDVGKLGFVRLCMINCKSKLQVYLFKNPLHVDNIDQKIDMLNLLSNEDSRII